MSISKDGWFVVVIFTFYVAALIGIAYDESRHEMVYQDSVILHISDQSGGFFTTPAKTHVRSLESGAVEELEGVHGMPGDTIRVSWRVRKEKPR